MNVVLVCPGQGSQKPGMGRELAEAFGSARNAFARADEALGVSLSRLCFEGPEEELTSTQNAQPALLAHSAAAWSVVGESLAPFVRAAAGHSLGEFSAHHAAGALPLEDALRVVRRRGELMFASGTQRPGAMAAILGLDESKVEACCQQATREAGTVVPANYNSRDQLVISGEVPGVERAMELCRDAGAKRALRLNVSGAFHSPLMEIAADGLRQALAGARFADGDFPVWSNVTAAVTAGPDGARELLLRQLTSPVRWTAEVMAIAAEVPDALWVELGPGAVLSGLVRRIVPDARTATCGTPADVGQLLEKVA